MPYLLIVKQQSQNGRASNHLRLAVSRREAWQEIWRNIFCNIIRFNCRTRWCIRGSWRTLRCESGPAWRRRRRTVGEHDGLVGGVEAEVADDEQRALLVVLVAAHRRRELQQQAQCVCKSNHCCNARKYMYSVLFKTTINMTTLFSPFKKSCPLLGVYHSQTKNCIWPFRSLSCQQMQKVGKNCEK